MLPGMFYHVTTAFHAKMVDVVASSRIAPQIQTFEKHLLWANPDIARIQSSDYVTFEPAFHVQTRLTLTATSEETFLLYLPTEQGVPTTVRLEAPSISYI